MAHAFEVAFKPCPCAAEVHRVIDAAFCVTLSHDVAADRVQAIRILVTYALFRIWARIPIRPRTLRRSKPLVRAQRTARRRPLSSTAHPPAVEITTIDGQAFRTTVTTAHGQPKTRQTRAQIRDAHDSRVPAFDERRQDAVSECVETASRN
jgi:hypothetical protein